MAKTNWVVLTKEMKQKIDKKTAEIQKKLPHIRPLNIHISLKKTALLYHPRKHYHSSFGSYLKQKYARAFYIGTISLHLPKQTLQTHFMGKTINECFKKGVTTVEKQLEKYKDHYFKSQSAYRDHRTIRRDYEIV